MATEKKQRPPLRELFNNAFGKGVHLDALCERLEEIEARDKGEDKPTPKKPTPKKGGQ